MAIYAHDAIFDTNRFSLFSRWAVDVDAQWLFKSQAHGKADIGQS